MIDKNNALLNRVKGSFEEILEFSKFFEFEGYTYCKLQILSYKKNNIWIIEYMRQDFILEPDDQVRTHISKEGNALYVQFSKPIINLLEIINFDKNGVHLSIDDYHIYFNNKFKSISHAKIINKLKNQYPYQFKESKVKLYFYFIHELYSSYSLNQFKYQKENFQDTNTGLIYTGEDIFNDLMEMEIGLFNYSLIIFVFPIYSFSLSHKILKEEDKITIVFEKKIPNKLQDSIELYYQLDDENNRNLSDKIIISKNFSGRITISIKWYGDEAFLPKGTLLYNEKILIEKDQKEMKQTIQKNKKEFIEIDFNLYQLPDYIGIKDLINLCADHPEFYKVLPNLIRNLYENLLRDTFHACLVGKYTHLYYNTNRGRVKNFSKLIKLLNTLRSEFDSSYGMVISNNIIENLDKFRNDANYNIHQIKNVIEPSYAEKNKEKFIVTLEILLQLFRKITTSNKKINNIAPKLLKKFEEKHSTRDPQEKINNNQIHEISILISSIRSDLDNQVTISLLERRITVYGKNAIQKKIDELPGKIIQLKIKKSSFYDRLIYSITKLDREFNSEFLHRETLLQTINNVATYFKYAISEILSREKKESKENDTSTIYTLKIILYLLSVFLIITVIAVFFIIF